jgi:hypothetical protein
MRIEFADEEILDSLFALQKCAVGQMADGVSIKDLASEAKWLS